MKSRTEKSAPGVFDYRNYREFIRDWIESGKPGRGVVSVRSLSLRIGASASYLKLVLSEKRSLSLEFATRLAGVMELDPASRSYLVNLVLRDGARAPAVRRHFDLALADLKKSALDYHADRKRLSVFSSSLTWEIFSLIGVDGFEPTPQWIAKRLTRSRISELQIRESLQFLLDSGAVIREGDRLKAGDVILKDGQDLRPIYAVALRRALERLDSSRNGDPMDLFESFCLILSDSEYRNVQEIVRDAKERIATVARKKGPKSRIAYLNMNLFHASR